MFTTNKVLIMNYTTYKVYRKLTLPISVKATLDALGLSRIQQNNCYHILYLLTVNPSRDRSLFLDWQPLDNRYLNLRVGRGYIKAMKTLGDAGIIDCDGVFHEGKALCYRINSSVDYSGGCETLTFYYSSKVPLVEFEQARIETYKFTETISNLNINFNALESTTAKCVSNLSIKDYTTNYDIIWDGSESVSIVDDFGFTRSTYMNKQQAMTFAANNSYEVIQDGKEIKIMDAELFIKLKKAYVKAYYTNCIEGLKEEDTVYAKRNSTNNRLDTNFTSMPSELLDVIYKDNNIVELDQKNSQPALLAYKMDLEGVTGEGIELFKRLAYEGSFYEYMAKKLRVERKRAKSIMFEVLFSSSIANSTNKKVFRGLFPEVFEYIKQYKKENGKNEFSIMLQKLESSVFIDEIFKPLTKMGIPLMTKHDSVACWEADYPIVSEHINKVYRNINFKGTLEVKKVA